MNAEQMIIMEKKRIATASQNLSATELSHEGKAIAAVMDKIIARLPNPEMRAMLATIKQEREGSK